MTLLPRILDSVLTATGIGGGWMMGAQLKRLGFGILIVAFLLFEPRGLVGIWQRLRDYWRSWPFSY